MIPSHLRRVALRFPFVVLLLLVFVFLVEEAVNDWTMHNNVLAVRLAWAFGIGVILALAGALYREGHNHRWRGLLLAFILPMLAIWGVATLTSLVVHATTLLAASVLWLSVAAHVGRRGADPAFVWFNRIALWEGLFGLLLVFVLSVGLFAIQYVLASLFDIVGDTQVVENGLPLLFCLVGPIFWLARLPGIDPPAGRLRSAICFPAASV